MEIPADLYCFHAWGCPDDQLLRRCRHPYRRKRRNLEPDGSQPDLLPVHEKDPVSALRHPGSNRQCDIYLHIRHQLAGTLQRSDCRRAVRPNPVCRGKKSQQSIKEDTISGNRADVQLSKERLSIPNEGVTASAGFSFQGSMISTAEWRGCPPGPF